MSIGTRFLRRFGLLAVGVAVVVPVIGAASPAAAVAIISSTPADGADLVTSPSQVIATFDQVIGSAFKMEIVCNGSRPAYTAARQSDDALSLIIDVAATPLPKGECTVAWVVHGVAATGTDQGTFSFTIQQDTVLTQATVAGGDGAATEGAATAADQPGSDSTASVTDSSSDLSGPIGLFRWLSTIALASLFGALALITFAWPEGVEYILTIRFLRTAWIAALVFTWLMVACIVASIHGDGFTHALVPTGWGDLTDSTPGIAVLARVLLVAASGWVAIKPERVIDQTTQIAAFAAPGLAVATLGFSRTGGELALVGYGAGIVHALAMAVWFGGLVLLARVVLAGPGEDDLVHAVRGFRRVSTPALLLTIVTGIVQVYRLDRGHLFDTTHGRLLLLKVVAVAGMVFVWMATRQFIRARLTRAESLSAPLAGQLRRAIGMEALIGVVVLAVTSWMLSAQPGNLSAARSSVDFVFEQRLTDATGKLDATISVTPAKVGANAVLVFIEKPTSGISNFTVRFDPPANAAVSPVVMTVLQFPAGVDGWYLPLDVGVPLPAAGAWTVTLELTSSDGNFRESTPLSILAEGATSTNIPVVTSPIVTSPPTSTTLPAATTVP